MKIYAETEWFTGDSDKEAGVDAVGLQLFLDTSLAVSESTTVGGQFFYAQGTDDMDEKQYHLLGNDFGSKDILANVGTNLHNGDIDPGRPYTIVGQNSGVVGGRLYAMVNFNSSLSVGASVAYLTPEEDSVTPVDSLLLFVAGVSYEVLDNSSFDIQLQYSDQDAPDVDSEFGVGVGFFVKF